MLLEAPIIVPEHLTSRYRPSRIEDEFDPFLYLEQTQALADSGFSPLDVMRGLLEDKVRNKTATQESRVE